MNIILIIINLKSGLFLISCTYPLQFVITNRLYKNKVIHTPGWDDEAKKQGLKEQDYWGGFVIDEMRIQVSNTVLYIISILQQ